MNKLFYKQESYEIIGACMEVHKELGCGFLEPVYQEALALELMAREIPNKREDEISISYKGRMLEKYYKTDFICYDKIILEIKALSELTTEHESQLINYLKATNFPLGILINFGQKSLEYKRIINKQFFSQ